LVSDLDTLVLAKDKVTQCLPVLPFMAQNMKTVMFIYRVIMDANN